MEREGIVLVYSHGAGQNVRVDRLPEIGETRKALSWKLDRDGCKGTNIAVALGRLGVKNTLITRVGNDVWADLCTGWLREAGTDISYVLRDDRVETTTGIVFIDSQGRNSIVLGDGDMSVPHELIGEGLEKEKNSRLFITGFEIEEEDALYGLKKAKNYGMTTILNPSPVGKSLDLEAADIIIVNEVEAQQMLELAGKKPKESMDWEETVKLLRTSCHCKNVVLTLGEKGYVLNENGRVSRGEGMKAKAVDTSGAGDGFLAALAYRLHQGYDLKDACKWANAYAAVSVGYSGTIPGYLPLKEVEKKINEMENREKRGSFYERK